MGAGLRGSTPSAPKLVNSRPVNVRPLAEPGMVQYAAYPACCKKYIIGCGPYWALCWGKQTVGYMLGVANRLIPHPTHPKSTTLDSRWAAQRGLGLNVAFFIEIVAFCIRMLR